MSPTTWDEEITKERVRIPHKAQPNQALRHTDRDNQTVPRAKRKIKAGSVSSYGEPSSEAAALLFKSIRFTSRATLHFLTRRTYPHV
jgi:hypothetical protein